MADQLLGEKIREVREDLKARSRWGRLQTERFLMAGGDLVGIGFGFEHAEVRWRFGADQVEVWRDGCLSGTIAIADTISSTDPIPASTTGLGRAVPEPERERELPRAA